MRRFAFTAAVFALFSYCGNAATNLVSNTAIVTNRVKQIVTYTMDTNGVAHVNDPTGRLIGTAEERALKVAAEGQTEIASAAADAAGTAMEEWNDFIRTNDTHVVYIAADITQDLPALAENLCGWVAGSWYDGESDHYYIWWNRDIIDYPPSMAARIVHEGGTNWLDATWADWDDVEMVRGVICHKLTVPRRNKNCVLRTGSIVTLGGPHGFDMDIHKVNIEINGTPAATTTVQLPLFYAITREGTNTVTRAYTNGFVNVENGFMKEPTNE